MDQSAELDEELKNMLCDPHVEVTLDSSRTPFVVVVLGPVYHSFPLFIEAGKQSPRTVYLVTDPHWLKKEFEGKCAKLLLKQGYSFDENKRCYLVRFNHKYPKIVYFVNLYARGAYYGYPEFQDCVGHSLELERHFGGPMCSSSWMEPEINDKIFTRILMREEGVCVPDFLAFIVCPPSQNKIALYEKLQNDGTVVVLGGEKQHKWLQIKESVTNVLKKTKWEEVVVKPSGPRFCSGVGVKFFDTKRIEEIIDYVAQLVGDIGKDEGVLLDRRILYREINAGGKKLDCCFRVMLSRNVDFEQNNGVSSGVQSACKSRGVTTGILGRFSGIGQPVAICSGGFGETIEYFAVLAGLSDHKYVSLAREMEKLGPLVFKAIEKYEASRVWEEDEPRQAQIDFVAVDVCVEQRGNTVVPVVVELNDQDSDGHVYLENLYPERKGESVRIWVKTMLARAMHAFHVPSNVLSAHDHSAHG